MNHDTLQILASVSVSLNLLLLWIVYDGWKLRQETRAVWMGAADAADRRARRAEEKLEWMGKVHRTVAQNEVQNALARERQRQWTTGRN